MDTQFKSKCMNRYDLPLFVRLEPLSLEVTGDRESVFGSYPQPCMLQDELNKV